jgi:hypothetical protein
MQVTFVFARMVPIGPNLFHNNEISKVIPWPKSTDQIYFLNIVL